LEERLVPDAVPLNNYEQYLLELINRGRADPVAEAARFNIDLNEGLNPGTIAPGPRQPLAPNMALYKAMQVHLQDMLTNQYFDHTGSDGSTPDQRMANAGYPGGQTGENLGWQGTSNSPDQTSMVAACYQNLFVDSGTDGRGHRLNLVNGDYKEVGPGQVTGSFMNFNAVIVGQDFGVQDGNSFLTGVVYTDTAQAKIYMPGEGIGQVTITAVSAQGTFSDVSGPAGGYALQLAPGTYTVTASGGTLQTPITVSGITIGTSNVKQDFVPSQGGGGAAAARHNLHPSASVLLLTTSAPQRLTVATTSADHPTAAENARSLHPDRVNAVFTSVTQSSHGIASARSQPEAISFGDDVWTSPFGTAAEAV
jgi:uncharacterized protein YkwD